MGKYRKVEKVNYWKGMKPTEKIDYFFQYYFWKVVIIVVAVALVALGIYQVATNYKPDFEIMLVTEKFILDDEINRMQGYFDSIAIDNNGDGHEVSSFSAIVYFTEEGTNMESYNLNLQQKLVIQLSTGEPRILICSQKELEYLIGSGLVLVPLPEGAIASETNANAVLLSDTNLENVPALEKVPSDYVVCMIEMNEKMFEKDKNVSKRDYTLKVFESMVK